MSPEVKGFTRVVRIVRATVDAITGRGNRDVKCVGTYAATQDLKDAGTSGSETGAKIDAGFNKEFTHKAFGWCSKHGFGDLTCCDWGGTGQPGAGEDAPHSRRTAPPQL